MKKKHPKFHRRNTTQYLRLGKRRKKMQKWRRPTGRDNKMRLHRKGYTAVVDIGYAQNKETRGKIEGRIPVVINNIKELEAIKENEIAIIGRVGKKKKIEIAKKATEKKIKIVNLNAGKFIKQHEKKKILAEKNKPQDKQEKK